MSTNDKARLELHRRLDSVLGAEEASTLMSHLPPVTWDQVATKEDLRALEANLRAEISVSASGLRTEMADLGTEMADLRTEVRTELAGVRTEMAHLRADLRTEISDAITRQTRWMLGFALALTSVMITVTRLIP
jgi:phosphoglycerate-specific signal transduction histidine kinase